MSEVKTNKISSLTSSNSDITLDPDGTGDVVVASGHKLGIGTTSPTQELHVVGDSDTSIMVTSTSGGYSSIQFGDADDNVMGAVTYNAADDSIELRRHDNATGLRIDSSGNVLVGTTDAAPRNLSSGSGIRLGYDGSIEAAKATNAVARLNRTGDDGEVIQVRRDGTTTGSIGTKESYPYIAGTSRGLRFGHSGSDAQIVPVTASGQGSDNNVDLGAASLRFDDVYAASGVTTGSDENDKQQIASLTAAEMTAAKAISKLFKTFKWNSAVAAKGDAARTHTGVMAQQVETALTDAGLNAGDYAFYMSNTWWETSTEVAAVEADEEAGIEAQDAYTRIDTYHTADEAPEGATQRTRLGIRYAELMAFVGAATEQRLADIETRLAALEG